MGFSEATLLLASEPPGLLPARQQMAVSLGWHIILACFGVAFPTIIYVMHRRGIVRDDPVALGTREAMGQGLGGAVRDRRGVGHRPQLRDGLALAGADGPVR